MRFIDMVIATLFGDRRADSTLRLTSRGEGITYQAEGREIEVGLADGRHPRVLTDSIVRWKDGQPLTDDEKALLFTKILPFVRRQFWKKPIAVINTDDPFRPLWERLCAEHGNELAKVEHTSDRERFQGMRDLFASIPEGKGAVVIDGTRITDPKDLDDALERLADRTRRNRHP